MRVLHVRLDEPGGGREHVRLILTAPGDEVQMDEIAIHPDSLQLSPLGWRRASKAIKQALVGADIVHAHGVRAAAAVRKATTRSNVKKVVTIHGLHSVRRAPTRKTLAANRVVLSGFDAVLTLSRSDRDELLAHRIVPAEKVRSIPAAIRPPAATDRTLARAELDLSPGHVALWVGRFVDVKDPLTFVRALAASTGDITGVMVGEGELRDEATDLARQLGARIHFTGWIEDPAPAYAAADVFVSTSRWEGAPIAALEAAASATPIVLSDCPGNRDLLEFGVRALTFPIGDHEKAADRLRQVAGDVERSRQRADISAAIVRDNFTAEQLRRNVMEVYTELSKT